VAYNIVKTEHSGAKRAKGAWMRKADAKRQSNRARRQNDRRAVREGR
jgi:hypothetical protein